MVSGVCCGLGESDKIEIEETGVLVDCETGKDMDHFTFGLIPGRTYRYEKRWAIKQAFSFFKTFCTREDARRAYDDLIEKLAGSNIVIDV